MLAVSQESGQTLTLTSVCDKYSCAMGTSNSIVSSVLGHADEVDECCARVGLEVECERREKLASLLGFLVGD